MSMASRLFVADDIEERDPEWPQIRAMYKSLASLGASIKIGNATLHTPMARAHESIRRACDLGMRVLYDIKLNDNPAAVEKAVRGIAKLGVWGFTCMASMPRESIAAAVTYCGDALPCGVSVFSSIEPWECREIFGDSDITTVMHRQKERLEEMGVPLMVCSGHELPGLRGRTPLKTVVVGIRDQFESAHDQKRVCTIEHAVEWDADYIIVGRAITEAPDPVDAAQRYIERMEIAHEKKYSR